MVAYISVAQNSTINCGQINICQKEFNTQNVYDSNLVIEKPILTKTTIFTMSKNFPERLKIQTGFINRVAS